MSSEAEYLFAPKRNKSSNQSGEPHHITPTTCPDPHRVGSNAWCGCDRCIAMPTASVVRLLSGGGVSGGKADKWVCHTA